VSNSYEVELVLDTQSDLGEGPVWDHERGLLYWVDGLQGLVHIYDPKEHTNRSISLNQYVGAMVLRKSSGAVVAAHHGFYTLDLETGALEVIHDPEAHIPTNRFNDGKCDPAGRFWAGSMDVDEILDNGTLYCLHPDLLVEPKLTPLRISNGMDWSLDRTKMYFIDTPTRVVMVYDYDEATGALAGGVPVIHIPAEEGYPDGMTLDAEGMIWVAHWEGHRVTRWNPHTGELLDTIHVPAPLVTSVAFGGEAMDELYITTARGGLREEALAEYPLSGALFRVKTSVRGLTPYRFEG